MIHEIPGSSRRHCRRPARGQRCGCGGREIVCTVWAAEMKVPRSNPTLCALFLVPFIAFHCLPSQQHHYCYHLIGVSSCARRTKTGITGSVLFYSHCTPGTPFVTLDYLFSMVAHALFTVPRPTSSTFKLTCCVFRSVALEVSLRAYIPSFRSLSAIARSWPSQFPSNVRFEATQRIATRPMYHFILCNTDETIVLLS